MVSRARINRIKTGLAVLGVIAAGAGALAPAASALNPQPLPPYQHQVGTQFPVDPA